MLVAHDLELAYGRHGPSVVTGVTLTVEPGESLAIVGESGSGKSSIARALAGVLAPRSGTVTIDGKDWSNVGWRDPRRRSVQMIYQDPYSSLNPRQTVMQTVREPMIAHRLARHRAATERAAALLASVGLPDSLFARHPAQLSGGQRQRVSIARALASDPAILIADEPTSSLDASVQAGVLELIRRAVLDRGMGLVLVSHDLGVVDRLTERTIVLRNGLVEEEGATSSILRNPTSTYTQELVSSVPGLTPGRDRPKGKNS